MEAFAEVVLQIARQQKHKLKKMKGFCSGTIARQTRPFWAKVGSWQTRLLPTFCEPSANLSRIIRLQKYFLFNLMFHERKGGCFSSNTKTHSYLRKNKLIVQWLYECNFMAKHEYYLLLYHILLVIWVYLDFSQTFRRPFVPFDTAEKTRVHNDSHMHTCTYIYTHTLCNCTPMQIGPWVQR